mgnify:CR=1 FL=1
MLMTAMTKQRAPILQAHFHALVPLDGPEMELFVKMWTNARLICITVMTSQRAPTLQAHFLAIAVLVGLEMGLIVKIGMNAH